jgi:hypothetical protein
VVRARLPLQRRRRPVELQVCVARSVGSVGHWPMHRSALPSAGPPAPAGREVEAGSVQGMVSHWGCDGDWRAVGAGRWVARARSTSTSSWETHRFGFNLFSSSGGVYVYI